MTDSNFKETFLLVDGLGRQGGGRAPLRPDAHRAHPASRLSQPSGRSDRRLGEMLDHTPNHFLRFRDVRSLV